VIKSGKGGASVIGGGQVFKHGIFSSSVRSEIVTRLPIFDNLIEYGIHFRNHIQD
jgi:hypothetical protein